MSELNVAAEATSEVEIVGAAEAETLIVARLDVIPRHLRMCTIY